MDKTVNHESYRRLIEASYDLIYELDAQGCFTHVHSKTLTLLGYDSNDLLGKDHKEIIHADYRDLAKSFRQKNQKQGEAVGYQELVLCSFSGHDIPVELYWDVIKQGEEVEGFYVIGNDLSKAINAFQKSSEDSKDGIVNAKPYNHAGRSKASNSILGEPEVLAQELKLQEILIDIASTYINLNPKELDKTIHLSLERMGKFVSADRAYIFEYDFNDNTTSNTYEWCEEGISPEIKNLQNVPIEFIPQWTEAHRKNLPFYVPDVSALADDGEGGLKSILEPQGIKSLIAIPMLSEHNLVGFVGFDSVKRHHHYSTKEQRLLHLFGQMLINIQHRQKWENQLGVQEEKYRNIISNINLGLLEVDLNDVILYANEGFCKMSGFSLGELKGQLASELLLDKEQKHKIYEKNSKRTKGISDNYELELYDKRGEKRHWFVSGAPNYNDKNQLIGSIGVHLDITERKKAEQELHEVKLKLSKYKTGLEAINSLTSNLSMNAEDQIQQGIKIAIDYLELNLAIISDINNDIYCVSQFYEAVQEQKIKIGDQFKLQDTFCDLVLSSEEVLYMQDVSDSKWKDHTCRTLFGIESYLGIPYRVHGKIRGTVNFSAKTARKTPFDRYDIEFIELFAKWVGYTLTISENQSKLKADQDKLAAKNLELHDNSKYLSAINGFVTNLLKHDSIYQISWEIAENVIDQFGFDDCVIYVWNEETQLLEQIAAYGPKQTKDRTIRDAITLPLGKGIVGDVALTGEAEIIHDTSKDSRYLVDDAYRYSEVAVPIVADGKVIGVIDSEHKEKNYFTAKHLDTLKTIANLAANRLKSAMNKLEQERAEKELMESEFKLRKILDNAIDAVITIDSDGIITEWNKQAEVIFGFTAEEVFGKTLTETIIPEIHRKAHDSGMEKFHETGYGPVLNQKIEITALRKNGQIFPVEMAIIPVESKGVHSFTAFLSDITIQKQVKMEMEKALNREKELNEMKSRFVSMTSHEFRTPLTTIKQNTDLIGLQLERDITNGVEKYHKYLSRIDSDLDRITALMNSILLLGRIESGRIEIKKQPVQLVPMIERMLQKFVEGDNFGRQIKFEFIGVPREVSIDPQLMEHALSNLLSNALKYSPNDKGPEVVLSFKDLSTIQIFVKDEGIGIPEKDQKKLFESFYRAGNVRNIQGTGLGLSIVKEFTEMHGGTIEVKSKEGMGSTFILSLPNKG